jgi:phage baseplate assembly protein W
MSTQFDRQLIGFRFVETRFGDTLQRIAAREMGDANRWAELIEYNNLLPPFITDNAAEAGPNVLLTGRQMIVPAPVAVVSTTTDPDEVFEADIQLGSYGELMTDGVDFVVVSGRKNLCQALTIRFSTDRQELMYHPEYGCDVRRLVGRVNGPTASILAAQAVRSAALRDPRVSRVLSATAEVIGDVINVVAEAETVAGRSVTAAAAL